MRRLAVFLSLLCLLSLPVSAAYIPESSVTENRDGRQLIIKTYQLSPEDDPSELVDEPFDLEGYHYEHLETVKEDQTFHDSKAHTETVTVTTSSDSLAAILEQLAPTMEYSKDGYSGVLTLDHTTLQTEAAGYTTKYYTITDTKQFTGLPRNDPSYVPTTTVKDGKTLSLSNILGGDRDRSGRRYPGANFLYSYRNLPGYRKPECGNRIYHHGHLYGRDHIRRDWLRPIYGDLSGDTAEVRIFDRASSSGFAGGRVGNACGYPGFSISAPAKCGHLCDERKRCCI